MKLQKYYNSLSNHARKDNMASFSKIHRLAYMQSEKDAEYIKVSELGQERTAFIKCEFRENSFPKDLLGPGPTLKR